MKKTILHFIHSLGRGGAEVMLVRTLQELKEYRNIVVTVKDDYRFGDELQCDAHICLELNSIAALPLGIFKLKKIIREYDVDLVHTHLYWPTIISRFATPRSLPLITTIHAFIASSVEYTRWYIRLIDKISYRWRRSEIVAVAAGALDDYFNFLHLKPWKKHVLYTFVDLEKFQHQKQHGFPAKPLRLVSTGALRVQKNFPFLIRAFALLPAGQVELDIYGRGPLQQELQDLVDEKKVQVNLKGEIRNIEELLPQYDAFVLASTFEGFSLAVLEAMAVKLPLLLSNIASFNEQAADTARYFKLDDEQNLANKILELVDAPGESLRLSDAAFDRVQSCYTLPIHMQKLRWIYSSAFKN
ncbi:MAG: hypothetical protein JWQ27_2531 [Ferruginibacter sp.]|nr:hypothetical protein [Ferruginibacter sp.]